MSYLISRTKVLECIGNAINEIVNLPTTHDNTRETHSCDNERTETHAGVSPCDVCRHYPPSSADGKPCSMCPVEPAEPTEQVRIYTSLADCVSRQAAINAINSWFEIAKHPMNRGAYNNGELAAYSTAISEIENLPSAETFSYGHENDWIPASERLPEDEGWYLVTDDSGGVLWLEVEHYDPEIGLEPLCTIQNPVAWMPMPEPYNGGEQE